MGVQGGDGEQSGYIMRSAPPPRLPTLTPFVPSYTVPMADAQRSAQLYLVLLHCVALCWKWKFKVAARGVGVGEEVLHK